MGNEEVLKKEISELQSKCNRLQNENEENRLFLKRFYARSCIEKIVFEYDNLSSRLDFLKGENEIIYLFELLQQMYKLHFQYVAIFNKGKKTKIKFSRRKENKDWAPVHEMMGRAISNLSTNDLNYYISKEFIRGY